MNQSLKIVLAGLVMCIMTQGLMLFIDHYVLVHLGDWTMAMTNKFLVFDWTITDKNLIRWFPLIVGVACAIIGVRDLQIFIKRVFWTLLTVLGFILIAILIGLFTWTSNGGDSPLLPEYLKYQPFSNYWTVFIAVGILLPLIPLVKSRVDNVVNNEIIDK